MSCMFFEKQHDAVHRRWQMIVNIDVVKNLRLVGADEAAALHPGI